MNKINSLLSPILIALVAAISGCGGGTSPPATPSPTLVSSSDVTTPAAGASSTPSTPSSSSNANLPPPSKGTAPTVSAGSDLSILQTDSAISLIGGASDVDGKVVNIIWTQESGPNKASLSGENSPRLGVSGLIAGTYTFRLTATDNQGNVVFDEAQISVLPALTTTPAPITTS
ncbi:MAG: hypothetical protein ACI9ZF_002921, partial [Bradyrhizobium sp.]